jgi:hypothetical protein
VTAAESGAPDRLEGLRARLRLYEDLQPYRVQAGGPEKNP